VGPSAEGPLRLSEHCALILFPSSEFSPTSPKPDQAPEWRLSNRHEWAGRFSKRVLAPRSFPRPANIQSSSFTP
jgi:hypothetical protein